jgi:hypothetical protein
MKKLLPLLLCISLSFFTVARATRSAYTPPAGAKAAQKIIGHEADAEPLFKDASKGLAGTIKAARVGKGADSETAKNGVFRRSDVEDESLDFSYAKQPEVATDEETDEEVTSADNASTEDASDDEGEDVSDEGGGAGDPSDADIADDDGGSDDVSDDGGDEGGGGD